MHGCFGLFAGYRPAVPSGGVLQPPSCATRRFSRLDLIEKAMGLFLIAPASHLHRPDATIAYWLIERFGLGTSAEVFGCLETQRAFLPVG